MWSPPTIGVEVGRGEESNPWRNISISKAQKPTVVCTIGENSKSLMNGIIS